MPISAKETVPAIYRYHFTIIAPLLTILGVIGYIHAPADYVTLIGGQGDLWHSKLDFMHVQLCGTWLAMAWNGAVMLRLVDDRRVWTLFVAGMVPSDFVFLYSCAQAMGGWREYLNLRQWTLMNWVNFWTSFPSGAIRICFLLGVGFREPRKMA